MKKAIIFLAFVLITGGLFGQALPSGSVPFGTQLWIAPDGAIWTGTDNNGFKNLVTMNNMSLQTVTDVGSLTDNIIGVKSGELDFTTDGPTTFYGYAGITSINAPGFGIIGFDNYPESPTLAPYNLTINGNSFSLAATGPHQDNARLSIGNFGMAIRNKVSYDITGGILTNDYDLQKTQYRYNELIQITDSADTGGSQVFMQRALYHDIGIAGFNMEYVDENNGHSAVGISASADSAMVTFYTIDNPSIWQIGRRTGSANFIIKSSQGDVVIEGANANPVVVLGKDGRVSGSPGVDPNDFATVSQLSGGGGGVGTLQSVTDAGSTTTNALVISADAGSLWMDQESENMGVIRSSNGTNYAQLLFKPTPNAGEAPIQFNARVSGSDAVNTNEFATLSQAGETFSYSTTAVTANYIVPHNAGFTPSSVHVTPNTSAAAGIDLTEPVQCQWWAEVDATNVTIRFHGPLPPAGERAWTITVYQ